MKRKKINHETNNNKKKKLDDYTDELLNNPHIWDLFKKKDIEKISNKLDNSYNILIDDNTFVLANDINYPNRTSMYKGKK